MKPLNFKELLRKAEVISDFNAKELYLQEARANYQQNILFAGNAYLMQIESAIALVQKERELSVSFSPCQNEAHPKSNKLKISVCLVLELLNLLGKGRSVNDLTTLSRFASIITGFSKDNILNTMQMGIVFSKRHHDTDIKEVNEVLQRLQVPVGLEVGSRY
jgi:hypothetical protein